MKQKNLFFIASLAILIPSTGRLGYGLIVLLALICINSISGFLFILYKNFHIQSFEVPLRLFTSIAITIIFKEVLRIYSPILAFTIHFSLYLVCFTSFLFTLQTDLENTTFYFASILKQSLLFSLFGIFFYSIREYIAYASISLPSKHGLYYISLPSIHLFSGSFLWSSIAFALILLALILIIFSAFQKKNETSIGRGI